MRFDEYIGIDYSGAESMESRLKGLQVFTATGDNLPVREWSPYIPGGQRWNWTRQEIARWLVSLTKSGKRFIAGIDHCFSFPDSYFQRYKLNNWDEFLADFSRHWPAEPYTYLDMLMKGNRRRGFAKEYRLTERWTSSAKSVFLFNVTGQVAASSHAGIPWLYYIRQEIGDLIHFWPFDGFDVPAGSSVIAEVYPSIFRHRYLAENRSGDEQDAYAIARWLSESDSRGIFDHYFHPPLNEEEARLVSYEGWILGIC